MLILYAFAFFDYFPSFSPFSFLHADYFFLSFSLFFISAIITITRLMLLHDISP